MEKTSSGARLSRVYAQIKSDILALLERKSKEVPEAALSAIQVTDELGLGSETSVRGALKILIDEGFVESVAGINPKKHPILRYRLVDRGVSGARLAEDNIRFAEFYGARLISLAPAAVIVAGEFPMLLPMGAMPVSVGSISGAQLFQFKQAARQTALTTLQEPVAVAASLAEEEVQQQIALETRQARVFERALAELGVSSDTLEGVLGVELKNFNPESLEVLKSALANFNAQYPNVQFYFMGSDRLRGVSVEAWERSKAKRIAITDPDNLIQQAGYVTLDPISAGQAYPAKPILRYAAYLLGIRTHENPQAITVPNEVLAELGRLAGNPTDGRLNGLHIIGFAMGLQTPEMLAIARTYTVRAVKFMEATLRDYITALQAVGQSA